MLLMLQLLYRNGTISISDVWKNVNSDFERFGIFNVTADKYIQYIWLHANHLKIVALEYECNVSDGS